MTLRLRPARSLPVYLVASFAKGGVRIVATPESGIKTISDLKGKKVGVARGGAQELALLAELDKHGLTWSDRPGKDVQIIYLASYPDVNQALQGKNIDALKSWLVIWFLNITSFTYFSASSGCLMNCCVASTKHFITRRATSRLL